MDVPSVSLFYPRESGADPFLVTDFPDEMLIDIMGRFPFRTLVSLSLTCKKFQRLCNDRVLLRRDAALADHLALQLGIQEVAASPTAHPYPLGELASRVDRMLKRIGRMSLMELASFEVSRDHLIGSALGATLQDHMIQELAKRVKQIQSCYQQGYFELGPALTKIFSSYSLQCFFKVMESKVGIKHLLVHIDLPKKAKSSFLDSLAGNEFTFEELTLIGEGVEESFVRELSQALSTNTTVKRLKLRSIQFHASDFKTLADGLSSNTTLEHLEINQFSFDEVSVHDFARILCRPCMRSINLEHASNREVELLCAVLKNSPINTIGLSKSFVGGKTAQELIQLLKGNREINSFALSQSFVAEEDLALLVQELSKIAGLCLKLPRKISVKSIGHQHEGAL